MEQNIDYKRLYEEEKQKVEMWKQICEEEIHRSSLALKEAYTEMWGRVFELEQQLEQNIIIKVDFTKHQ